MNEPGYKEFDEGWERWVEKTSYAGLYWDHSQLRWKTYSPAKFLMRETAHAALSVWYPQPAAIWPQLLRAWHTVSITTPQAVWSPHSYKWYTWAHLTPPPPPPPPPPGERERAMLAELKRLDELYAQGKISGPERQRSRDEILSRYHAGG